MDESQLNTEPTTGGTGLPPEGAGRAEETQVASTAILAAHLNESISSISFVGLLFTVSLAVLALSLTSLKDEPVVAVPLFVSIIACFYSSITYAVVAGQVRSGSRTDALRSIGIGNILSEWYGVYALIMVFSPVIGRVSGSAALCVGSLIANLLGYVIYATTSNLSMMSRFAHGWGRFLAHSSFTVLLAAGGIGAAIKSQLTVDVSIIASLAWCVIMSIWHALRGEGEYLPGISQWRFRRSRRQHAD